MSGDWQFVLNQTSVQFLISLRGRRREQLVRALDALANDPMQKGDFEVNDDTGRRVQVKAVGRFMITFWPDVWVQELRVINIEWI